MGMFDYVTLNYKHVDIGVDDLGKLYQTKDLTNTCSNYEITRDGILKQTSIVNHWGSEDDLLESVFEPNMGEYSICIYRYGIYQNIPIIKYEDYVEYTFIMIEDRIIRIKKIKDFKYD